VLVVLACITIFLTAFALMLPAISMTHGTLVCTLEEHAHSADCYEQVLVCDKDEGENHAHGDACYESELVCGKDEHVHGDGCYEQEQVGEDAAAEDAGGPSAHDANGESAPSVSDGRASESAAAQGDGAVSAAGAVDAGSDSPMPAQSFVAELANAKGEVTLTVSVEAPEGAFPAGTAMVIEEVPAGDIREAVDKAVSEKTDGRVTKMQAVDIAFKAGGPDGDDIEPACDITVTLTSPLIAQNEKPLVVHVDDVGEADVVDTLTKKELKKRDLEAADDQLLFDSDKFSTYGIVITTLEKTLVASDGKTYTVTVTCPEGAGVPEGADLEVREIAESSDAHADYVAKTEDALGVAPGEISYIRLFDIKIVDKKGGKVDIAAPVDVKIELADKDAKAETHIVHFADGAKSGDVVDDVKVDGQSVSFSAEGFSIYAIVDGGGDDARVGYRFWYNDGTQNVLLSTQYFRYKDVHPDSGNALTLNEPSIPDIDQATWNRIFRGWSKTSFTDDDANLLTVHDLNSELAGRASVDYVEGTFVDVYVNLRDVYYVTYVDVNPNNVLATEIVPKAESGDTAFDVKPESQLRPTIGSDAELQGWYDIDHPETVYEPGQPGVVVDSNITLYPKVAGGSWLIFDDNDMVPDGSGNMVSGGASFTPPAFYLNSNTERPADPTWDGYEFGGWYTDPDCTNEFVFGGELSHDTTVYAKWTPSASSYRVVIWKQRSSDDVDADDADKLYDYDNSYLVEEGVVTGQTVQLDPQYTRIYGENGTSTDSNKGYFTYNADKTNQSVVVKADGTSVLNVYYDREPITLNYYTWEYAYTPTTSNSGTLYGLVDGDYVQLTRGGNNPNYTWTYGTGEYEYTYTPTTGNNGTQYGLVDGEYVQLVRHGGGFFGPYYWTYGDDETRYDGTRYTRSETEIRAQYEGTRYTRGNNRAWRLYKTFTGLYGSTLKENGYTWPNKYDWYANGNNYGGTSGTRTTFMNAFLPTDNQKTVRFYGSAASGSSTITFNVQELDGSYTPKNSVAAGAGTFYISDKYSGYHASQYRVNGGDWRNVGPMDSEGYYNNGNGVSYNNSLDIRFDLNDYELTFYTNNGLNQTVKMTVPYSQSLSGYADQNPGQYTGHYFTGWYADPGCSEPFDFNQTMPDNNVAVYGGWEMERFRIVIETGADNVYIGSQAKSFRVDYDERIDGGLLENAQRAGYILDGWYTDPDFTNRFLFSDPVNSNTTDVDMTYHSSPEWAAARAAYGDDAPSRDNVRGILHLYAKWIPDPNSTGINVVYDAGDAALVDSLGNPTTTVPIDAHMYAFDGLATGREAPSNYNDLYTFKYWEATKSDGTTVTVYPGDPVALADLTFTDPVYDEDGVTLLRKTVTLRAVYDLTGDPARITHITFDGNTFNDTQYSAGGSTSVELSGETRDGTHRQSVTSEEEINATITLPTADDFYLDGWTLVGWSFTKGAYEGQVAGADDDDKAPNFKPGQEVAADNLIRSDLNDTGNTLYAMWQPKEYTVTVKQVIEDGVTDHNFAYPYKTGVEDAIGSATETVQTLTGNSSFSVEHLEYYNRVGHVIHVTTPNVPADAAYDVRVNAVVTKDDGTTEILNPTAAGDYQILGDVTITYTYSPKVLVKLQKRDATDHEKELANAVFVVTPVEFNSTTQHWENVGSGETITVTGDTLEKYLQEGTYRIVEVTAPFDYALIGVDLYLTVDKDEAFTLFMENGSSVSANIAELTGTEEDMGKVLTVYDRPIHTVTLSKQVDDEQGTFAFTVTVFDESGTRLRNYAIGDDLTTNNVGQASVSLGHGQYVVLRIPHGYKIVVEEAANARYEASYAWNNGESEKSRSFGTAESPVSIYRNGALAFTNTLVAVPVTLVKTGVDNTDAELVEEPLAGATFTVYTSEGGSEVATGIGQNGASVDLRNLTSSGDEGGKGIFFNGRLKVGTYYLEETTVPGGYNAPAGRFTLVVEPGVAPAILAPWDTGNPTHAAGTVSGDAESGYTVTVRNVAGAELPHTGGSGTTLMYVIGIMLVGFAAATLIAGMRRGGRKPRRAL